MELLGNLYFHYTDNVRYLKANSRRKCIIVKSARSGLVWSGLTPSPVTDQELSSGAGGWWMSRRALPSTRDPEETTHMVCRDKTVFRS